MVQLAGNEFSEKAPEQSNETSSLGKASRFRECHQDLSVDLPGGLAGDFVRDFRVDLAVEAVALAVEVGLRKERYRLWLFF